MSKPRNTFLDGDSAGLENNLKFVKNEFEEGLRGIFEPESSGNSENANSRIIQPDPANVTTLETLPQINLLSEVWVDNYEMDGYSIHGYKIYGVCIKAFNDTEKKKLFINICQTEYIPAPPEKSEDELRLIINSNNVTTYKIPMSISDLRKVMDKSGNFATACDIAINSNFFAKIKTSDLFRHFFITIVFEAIENKYEIQLNLDNWTILKNRQAMGGLIKHRIRDSIIKQTDSAHKLFGGEPGAASGVTSSSNTRAPKKLIEVIDGDDVGSVKAEIKTIPNNENYVPSATKLSISQAGTRKPDYRLFKRVESNKSLTLVAEFHLPECLSSREIALDIGEDRLILEARKRGYYFDSFVDYSIDQEKTSSQFHVDRGILSVEMPVIAK